MHVHKFDSLNHNKSALFDYELIPIGQTKPSGWLPPRDKDLAQLETHPIIQNVGDPKIQNLAYFFCFFYPKPGLLAYKYNYVKDQVHIEIHIKLPLPPVQKFCSPQAFSQNL